MPFYDNIYDDSYGRERRLFDDVTILPADRKPCLVCGHPTGDCAGDKASQTKIAGFGVFESLKAIQTFLIEEDVYEERQITPFLKAKVLLHKQGKQIPYLEAERLGLTKSQKE
jgi:hypothetical protein